MLTPARWFGAALVTILCAGCSFANVWNEVPATQPSFTPAPSTPDPEPDDRTLHPYVGTLAANATCRKATKAELSDLEDIGGVGEAVTYPVGVLVKSSSPWWTAAVATRVARNSDGAGVPKYAYFVTSWPTYGKSFDHEPFAWQLFDRNGDHAAAKALACLKKLPVPKEKPEPSDPASYTGVLAAKATCTAVSGSLLARLEQVGQVGGAITYPRGRMVHANLKWWTVAVETEVHANAQGYTRDNVPTVEYFVTNVPSVGSKTVVVSFPITVKSSDAAAKKARACLGS